MKERSQKSLEHFSYGEIPISTVFITTLFILLEQIDKIASFV